MGDFPGGLVVKTSPPKARSSQLRELRSQVPCGKKKTKTLRQKEYCNKFNKDFKSGPYPKKKSVP